MQRTIVRDKPVSLGELYDALYNSGSQDCYGCFIDRKNGGGDNLSKLFSDLSISSIINDDDLIDI